MENGTIPSLRAGGEIEQVIVAQSLSASPLMMDGQAVKNYVPNNDLDAVGADSRLVGQIRTSKLIRPRVFDASIPFLYLWAFDDDDQSKLLAEAICALAERLYQLGRGIDLAWAWGEVIDNEKVEAQLSSYPGAVYRPSRGGSGRILVCPESGSLRDCATITCSISPPARSDGIVPFSMKDRWR
jgi:CRISPR-associated protein Csb2